MSGGESEPDVPTEVASQPTILVVDDEKNIRLTVVDALAAVEARVITAVSGEDALQRVADVRSSAIPGSCSSSAPAQSWQRCWHSHSTRTRPGCYRPSWYLVAFWPQWACCFAGVSGAGLTTAEGRGTPSSRTCADRRGSSSVSTPPTPWWGFWACA